MNIFCNRKRKEAIIRSNRGQQHVRSLSLAEKVAKKKTARHNSRDDGLASQGQEGVGRGDYDFKL